MSSRQKREVFPNQTDLRQFVILVFFTVCTRVCMFLVEITVTGVCVCACANYNTCSGEDEGD